MLDVVIKRRKFETPDILSFELVSTDGSRLPEFDAGSHIDVRIDEKITRQYSLYNDPLDTAVYRIGVLRDPQSRGGSVKLHDRFEEGDKIQVSTPRNLFPLDTSSSRVLLFAGGIGITPILSMAEVLNKKGNNFELHYFAKNEQHAAFFDYLNSAPFASKVVFHFDDSAATRSDEVAQILSEPASDTDLYTCGPNGFMDFIFNTALDQGWNPENLHKEVFSAESQAHSADDKSFEVYLNESEISLTIPADKTVLEVLEEAGIYVNSSCEQGICGACLTTVTEGIPDHRDQFLTESERALNNEFTPCCSRAKSDRLAIDL